MTSRDFCYWLQGYFELADAQDQQTKNYTLSAGQIGMIKNHLAMVFKHEIDPSHGDAAHQAELSKAHQGGGDAGPGPFHRPPKARC